MIAATPDAYQLMMQGSIALAQVEANGIRMDVPYLKNALEQVKQEVKQKEEQLKQSEAWQLWRKRFGEKANLSSRTQLGTVLFDLLKLPCEQRTASGRPSTDVKDLELLEHPFITAYVEKEKLVKLHGTYLTGTLREVEGEFIHPSFGLNLAVSMRGQSDSPNWQNIPRKDKAIAKWIRTGCIPREGNIFLEIDYGGAEIRVAACYHKDPTMLKYLETGHDLHKDMARECFKLKADEVTKETRDAAKNGFVFASFYGSYYASLAKGLWQKIGLEKLKTAQGIPIKEHLTKFDITEMGSCNPNQQPEDGTFEKHIQKVEHRFWNKRFPIYKKWKEDAWNAYCKDGYFTMLTGFVCQGVFKRNQVLNYGTQGGSFHCLLWSIIQLTYKFRRYKLRSLIVGQIHDSLLIDCTKDELKTVLEMARQVMTIDIRKAWPWIITPLVVEAEGSEKNWFEKVKIDF